MIFPHLRQRRPKDDEAVEPGMEQEWTFTLDGEPVTLRIKGMKRIKPTLIGIFLKIDDPPDDSAGR